jgi:hypothetical protein
LLSWGGVRRATRPDRHPEFELDRFFIAGFRFHEGPAIIGRMRRGNRLALCAEPDNPYDAGAVRLEFAGRHVGYVPRSNNAVIGRLLAQRAPLLARIVTVDPAVEPWKAVQVAVALPARSQQLG